MDKKLRVNFIFNFITQLITVITPLILSPYISRVFDVNLIGDYNYCYSIISIFGLFANMGISIYGVTLLAKVKDQKEERTKAFLELFVIKLIFAILTTIVYLIMVFYVFDKNYTTYFLLFGIYILSILLDITWFFQAMENFRIICIRTLIVKMASLICIFALVKSKADMNLYILITMLSQAIPNLLLFIPLKKEIKLKKYKLDIKKHMKPILELLLPGIAYTVSAMIDKTMIKFITGSTADVGYYEQAYKLAFVGVTIISVFSTVLSSRISSMKNDDEIKELHKYSYAIILVVSIPLMIGLYILADYFIPFYYGAGYEKSINILKLFSVLPLVIGISNFVSYQYFIPKIITKPSMIIITLSIIVNILLNSIFIKLYGGFGSALATVMSEIFISALYMWLYSKYQKISIIFKTVYKYFLSGIVTFFIVYGINMAKPCTTFVQFVVYAMLIVIIFFIGTILMKDEIILKILKQGYEKIRRVESEK